VAYLVTTDDTAEATTPDVRTFLAESLPDYMVPTAYQPIDRIPLTANGKVDHRALPSPDLDAFAIEEYVAPNGPVEERLAAVWSEVLGVPRVGSTDNFFALGGDSIRAVQVLAACREAGLSLAVWMILQATSLAELATMVTVEQGSDEPDADDIPLTPSQHHVLTTTATTAAATTTSRTVRLPLSTQAEPALLASALESVVRHHRVLHTALVPAAGPQPPVLRPVTETPTGLLRFLDLRATAADGHAAAITGALDEARAALDPSRASTVRATLVRVDDRKPDELWLTVHALAADAGSFEVLAEDLDSAYRQLASGEEPVLPAPATPWQVWAGQLAEQALSPELLDQGERWLARPPATTLPIDHPHDRPNHGDDDVTTTVTVLPADLTAALLAGPQPAYPVLATLGRTLARWAGGDRIEIDVLTDPRHDPDHGPALSRTVGPLADTHPVSLRLPADRDTAATVAAVSRQLRALPAPVHGYGLLRHLAPDADLAAELAALPPAQVRFSWTPSTPSTPSARSTPSAPSTPATTTPATATGNDLVLAPAHLAPDASPSLLLHVDAHVQDDRLYLRWTYRPTVHTAATVHRLAEEQLAELSTHLRTTTAPTAPTARPRTRPTTTGPTTPTDPVPELMARHAVPGASIALLENGEVTSVRGYGVLGTDDPTPVTADTLFPAGSISKHVTTFLVLRLASEGVLDLDRDINEYLTSWQVPTGAPGTGNSNTGPVTTRLLLSNQSGLAPHPPLDDNYSRHEPFPALLDVLNGRAPAKTPPVRRADAPGEVFRLNPLNFSVLQQAMADATGTAFPELARHWLLEPLGMTASGFDPVFPDTAGRPFARGHAADGTPVPDGFVVHPEAAAGGLWTTAADLARLAAEIRRCYLGRPEGLVRQELVQRMLTPLGGRNYGWSTILDGTGADIEFGHGGQALGYQAMTGLRARSGTGAVLLSNGAGGRELVRYLLATVWSGQRTLGRLWQQAIDEATAREQAHDGATVREQHDRVPKAPDA
ncbi:serine hydrolase, partial [Kitasatospora purpeofusca]|uniref:serine hydrolase domain-containing protein n=1 Tax=Kitasatospora purpeofusca TaxID=67352 RepID=UPI0036F07B0F